MLSLCETVGAWKWHLRHLSDAGPKYSGGADTKTLCGLDAAWDLEVQFTDQYRQDVCTGCIKKLDEETP